MDPQPDQLSSMRGGLFVMAGEASGDRLGADLVRGLRAAGCDEPVWGVGGDALQAAGLTPVLPMEAFQIMGFVRVVTALPRLLKQLKLLTQLILERQPKAVVLIDYPDFNLRLARNLRAAGYTGKIVQYVCPTVWAWRSSRIPLMAERLDLLLTLFPFEPQYFHQTRLTAEYVGHPAASIQADDRDREDDLIALFPGSRHSEIELNLPIQLKAMRQLLTRHPDLRCVISVARPGLAPSIEKIAAKSGVRCALDLSSSPHLLMQRSQGAIATCGTVTLELALHGVPTVVTYKPSLLNALIARFIFRIRLPRFSIVNILGRVPKPPARFSDCDGHLDSIAPRSGEKPWGSSQSSQSAPSRHKEPYSQKVWGHALAKEDVFPERVHWIISPKEVARELEPLILETSQRRACLQKCREIGEILQAKPNRAAELVFQAIKSEVPASSLR